MIARLLLIVVITSCLTPYIGAQWTNKQTTLYGASIHQYIKCHNVFLCQSGKQSSKICLLEDIIGCENWANDSIKYSTLLDGSLVEAGNLYHALVTQKLDIVRSLHFMPSPAVASSYAVHGGMVQLIDLSPIIVTLSYH
jgi:hypothetical protein